MARMVATKAALSIRVDALSDADSKADPAAPSIGLENRAKLEARLRALEGQTDASVVRSAFAGSRQAKYAPAGEARTYNDKADFVSTQREVPAPVESALQAVLDVKAEKKRAKGERRAKKRAEKGPRNDEENGDADAMEVDGEKNKKEKKRKRRESEAEPAEKSSVRPLLGALILLYSFCASRMRMRRTRQSGRPRRRPAKPRRQRQRPRVVRQAVSRQKRSEESLRHSRPSHCISWLYLVISCRNICISSCFATV